MRDRIVELIRVKAGELEEHPSNWRRHPAQQRAALRGLLKGSLVRFLILVTITSAMATRYTSN